MADREAIGGSFHSRGYGCPTREDRVPVRSLTAKGKKTHGSAMFDTGEALGALSLHFGLVRFLLDWRNDLKPHAAEGPKDFILSR